MDIKALNSLSYGVFMLATKLGDRTNGCITNTCMQVTVDPMKVTFAVLNQNLTCEMIKESRVATLSILDKSVSFETIKHFGMQSGRDVDKMEDIPFPQDKNGVPYMGWGACAYLSLKVTDMVDMGTHTLFIAEVTEAEMLSENPPITYAEYHSDLKPKPAGAKAEKKIIGWRCVICNYVYEGAELPEDFLCPWCGHDISDFEPIYED
ncbi:MAG: flavin reductase [Clostridia bacterium]|nr:flavin reductase [Clostridia bacterium]